MMPEWDQVSFRQNFKILPSFVTINQSNQIEKLGLFWTFSSGVSYCPGGGLFSKGPLFFQMYRIYTSCFMLPDVQTCPWLKKRPWWATSTASLSVAQSSNITWGLFPPNSKLTFFRLERPAACWISLPTCG